MYIHYSYIVRRTRIVFTRYSPVAMISYRGPRPPGYRSSTRRARPCHPALNREIQLAALLLAELVSFLDKIQPRFLLCAEHHQL